MSEKKDIGKHESLGSLKSRTISSLAWKLFERAGSSIVQLVVQIVMARLLAPEQFGSLAIILVFVNLGNAIVQSGFGSALVQASEANEDDFTTAFWMCFALSFVMYVGLFFGAPSIEEFFNTPGLTAPLRVLSLVLFINSYYAVQTAYITRELLFRKLFVSTMASVVASGIVGVLLAWSGFGLWALVIQQLVYQGVNCGVLNYLVPWRPRAFFSLSKARELFSFGWKLLASSILETCYQSVSDLIIGRWFSAVQLGYVVQGKRYPQALGTMLDGTIQPVMFSAASRVQDDVSAVKRLVRRALKTSTYVILPCTTLFALVALPFVRLLLGEQWVPCVLFLQIYCLTFALLPIHTSNLQALNAMGRSDLFLKLEIIKKTYGFALLVISAVLLQDINMLVGSYFISGLISTFVNAHPNKRIIGYSYSEQIRDIIPSLALTLVSAAIAWLLCLFNLPDIVLIVLQSATMGAIYLVLSRIFHVEAFEYLVGTAREMLASRDS